MREKVVNLLKKIGLDDKQQTVLSMFPGLLFGFPPPNFKEMTERLDCPICQDILCILQQVIETSGVLNKKVDEFCRPVKERNERRQKKYQSRKKIFILGLFARKPKFEPEPDYKIQPWYLELKSRLKKLMEEDLESCRKKDPAHWGDDENEKISKEFTSAFFHRDCWISETT